MKIQSTEQKQSLLASLGAVVEWSLQPENQQIRPTPSDSLEEVSYRKMLDALERLQVEREVKASFSPF